MKCYTHKMVRGLANFGDDLNAWLWEKLMPGIFESQTDGLFLGAGSILSDKLPSDTLKIVMGAGAGYGSFPKPNESWKVYFVRGPKTAQALGLSDDWGAGDAALLAEPFILPHSRKKYSLSYMPHVMNAFHGGEVWRDVCSDSGFGYIDPQWNFNAVLEAIQEAEVLVTESLHGAIFADMARVPWIPVTSTREILAFKWIDWTSSIQLPYEPVRLPPLWNLKNRNPMKKISSAVKRYFVKSQLKKIGNQSKRFLSSYETYRNNSQRAHEKWNQFMQDCRNGLFEGAAHQR